jgi:class 3 adenylate cyclase
MSRYALIVDNDGDWRDLLARAVERVGLRQESASTPYRAIELIRKRSYSIALVDADLGSKQGTYACAEILAEFKAKGSEIPTVIVSGIDDLHSLTSKLSRNYSAVRNFSKAGDLLELETLVRNLTGLTEPEVPDLTSIDLDDLVEHIEYGFAFLKLDIVGHSAIYNCNRAPDIDRTLESFENFVEHEIKTFQGHILSWQGDGGLVGFVVGDKIANCGEAALSILYSLRHFNDNLNKTNDEVRVRIACHTGMAKYRSDHGRIHSAAINFVCHLEARGTEQNAVSLSEPFYKQLPDKVRKRFSPKGMFENVNVYEHHLT